MYRTDFPVISLGEYSEWIEQKMGIPDNPTPEHRRAVQRKVDELNNDFSRYSRIVKKHIMAHVLPHERFFACALFFLMLAKRIARSHELENEDCVEAITQIYRRFQCELARARDQLEQVSTNFITGFVEEVNQTFRGRTKTTVDFVHLLASDKSVWNSLAIIASNQHLINIPLLNFTLGPSQSGTVQADCVDLALAAFELSQFLFEEFPSVVETVIEEMVDFPKKFDNISWVLAGAMSLQLQSLDAMRDILVDMSDKDMRNPAHFEEIMALVKKLNFLCLSCNSAPGANDKAVIPPQFLKYRALWAPIVMTSEGAAHFYGKLRSLLNGNEDVPIADVITKEQLLGLFTGDRRWRLSEKSAQLQMCRCYDFKWTYKNFQTNCEWLKVYEKLVRLMDAVIFQSIGDLDRLVTCIGKAVDESNDRRAFFASICAAMAKADNERVSASPTALTAPVAPIEVDLDALVAEIEGQAIDEGKKGKKKSNKKKATKPASGSGKSGPTVKTKETTTQLSPQVALPMPLAIPKRDRFANLHATFLARAQQKEASARAYTQAAMYLRDVRSLFSVDLYKETLLQVGMDSAHRLLEQAMRGHSIFHGAVAFFKEHNLRSVAAHLSQAKLLPQNCDVIDAIPSGHLWAEHPYTTYARWAKVHGEGSERIPHLLRSAIKVSDQQPVCKRPKKIERLFEGSCEFLDAFSGKRKEESHFPNSIKVPTQNGVKLSELKTERTSYSIRNYRSLLRRDAQKHLRILNDLESELEDGRISSEAFPLVIRKIAKLHHGILEGVLQELVHYQRHREVYEHDLVALIQQLEWRDPISDELLARIKEQFSGLHHLSNYPFDVDGITSEWHKIILIAEIFRDHPELLEGFALPTGKFSYKGFQIAVEEITVAKVFEQVRVSHELLVELLDTIRKNH